MNCRHCSTPLRNTFVDLGFAPPSNAYLCKDDLSKPEKYYPLKVMVCDNCWLVQTEDYAQVDELFNADYAYFSSTSTGWLSHASQYVDLMKAQLQLSQDSLVIEIASNDGYLLKNFVAAEIPCLGIEPTDSTAAVAEALGIPVVRQFFGQALAKQLVADGKRADLIAGNNVYAHVPDIDDFTAGMRTILKSGGTITLEFPHLLNLIQHNQFDTIYHEHFSYLSLSAVTQIFAEQGLRIYNVEQLPTHGGSLRIYGCHQNDDKSTSDSVLKLLQLEHENGLRTVDTYLNFQHEADRIKNDLLQFLIKKKAAGKTVVGYGAAAKGNTLLNYAGVKPDLLPFVCDAAQAKQAKFMPGSHIPILPPKALQEHKPDYVLILPWNIVPEVKNQLDFIHEWNGKFVVAVPELLVS